MNGFLNFRYEFLFICSNVPLQFRVSLEQQILRWFLAFADVLTCAYSNLGIYFNVLLALFWSAVVISCPVCICGHFLVYITEIALIFKRLSLSDGNM
jgi:hypothetical protein